ncbi:MAG: hypothetical protein IID44_18570 [Planctomycetes bacterium]|nr:hypothetical protein [Planctomycetota bacterium]
MKQLTLTATIGFAMILAGHSTICAQGTTYTVQMQRDGHMLVGVYHVMPAGQPAAYHAYVGGPAQAYSHVQYGHVQYAAQPVASPYDWRIGRRSVLGALVGRPRGFYGYGRPAPGIYPRPLYYGR